MSDNEQSVYVTVNGLEIPIKAVPERLVEIALETVRRDAEKAGVPLERPHYETRPGDGKTIQRLPHYYDPEKGIDTLTDPDGNEAVTAANFAAWHAWQEAVDELESAQNRRRAEVYLMFGTDITAPAEDTPEFATWAAMLAYVGGEMPTDPNERKILWLETVLNVVDLNMLIAEITAQSIRHMMKPEDKDLFRERILGEMASRARAAIAGLGTESEG